MRYLLFLGPMVLLSACDAASESGSTPDPTLPSPGTDCADPSTWHADLDGDGFGANDDTLEACEAPSGYLPAGGDCNDDDDQIHPDAQEVCGGVDDDCDGAVDLDDDSLDASSVVDYWPDEDGDGFGSDQGDALTQCSLPSGYAASRDDCDDGDDAVHPGAQEVCNDIDDDCDQAVDDDDDSVDVTTGEPWYLDDDGDGHGDPDTETLACEPLPGQVDNAEDCDDTEEAAFIGAADVCDGVDNDCDGGVDGTPAAEFLCDDLVGRYQGPFEMTIDDTLVWTDRCVGTVDLTIDLMQDPPVQGTVDCHITTTHGDWDNDQGGDLSGTVMPDGTIEGTLTTMEGTSDSWTGTVGGGALHGSGDGTYVSWFVTWYLDFQFDLVR